MLTMTFCSHGSVNNKSGERACANNRAVYAGGKPPESHTTVFMASSVGSSGRRVHRRAQYANGIATNVKTHET